MNRLATVSALGAVAVIGLLAESRPPRDARSGRVASAPSAVPSSVAAERLPLHYGVPRTSARAGDVDLLALVARVDAIVLEIAADIGVLSWLGSHPATAAVCGIAARPSGDACCVD